MDKKWSEENLHAVHEISKHDLKSGVLCEISAWRISAFQKAINFENYVRLIIPSSER
jgi:hypothetical protein